MDRVSIILAALISLPVLTAATSPEPADSSHAIKTPPATPAAEKPKPAMAKEPSESAWRKAYVARTGHEPGASAKPHSTQTAAKMPAKHAMPLMKKKRCT